jgi:hypothetical protein
MERINLQRQVFSKRQVDNVVDTNFNQLVPTVPSVTSSISLSVSEFFDQYRILFFEIPKFGETNSHEYLVNTSGKYIETSPASDDTIQALIEEITQLRQQNLDLQQQMLSSSTSKITDVLQNIQNING